MFQKSSAKGVEPVRDPAKEEDQVKGHLVKPIYVLNSESFSVWQEHFEKLKRICLDARKTSGRGWLLTLTGSKHTDFSDYPFLLPRIFRSTVGPRHTMEVFCKATYMQMGLSRQRLHEQQNQPDCKVDRQSSPTNVAPDNDRAGLQGEMESDRVEQVASPTELERAEKGWAPSGKSQSGTEGRGNVVQSPICETKQGSVQQHEHVDANLSPAQEGSATPTIDRGGTATVASPETPSQNDWSYQELHEQSQHDQAEVGQQARDMVGERHRQMSSSAGGNSAAVLDKGFVTDVRYLKMIDADQDVQQVHEQLEEVAERFKNKSEYPSFGTREERAVMLYLQIAACRSGLGGVRLSRGYARQKRVAAQSGGQGSKHGSSCRRPRPGIPGLRAIRDLGDCGWPLV